MGAGDDHIHDDKADCVHTHGSSLPKVQLSCLKKLKASSAKGGGHQHSHHHGHHHPHSTTDNIRAALLLNLAFAITEIAGGFWTGSVAILSDAVHDFGDTLSLALAYFLEHKAKAKSSPAFSYGLRRMSLLSALITGGFLLAGSLWVLAEAIPRLLHPVQPKTEGMMLLALLGIAVNGYAAWRVQKGGSLNERVISWHFIEDVLGWVAVFAGGLIMQFATIPILDPILSIGFTLFILVGVGRTLWSTMHLFLQGAPHGIDLIAMRQEIETIDGVVSTHDAHLWSLDGEKHVLTMHVVMGEDVTLHSTEKIKNRIRALAASRGQIHVTIETESINEACPDLNCT